MVFQLVLLDFFGIKMIQNLPIFVTPLAPFLSLAIFFFGESVIYASLLPLIAISKLVTSSGTWANGYLKFLFCTLDDP